MAMYPSRIAYTRKHVVTAFGYSALTTRWVWCCVGDGTVLEYPSRYLWYLASHRGGRVVPPRRAFNPDHPPFLSLL